MTETALDICYMNRALQLAVYGAGNVSPNPMVGAVVVCDNTIIGEGYHAHCGGGHAEVNAIAAVDNPALLSRSTLYVTLEPCSHWGKTPPCCDLIIKCKIPRVVVAMQDPFVQVSGRGIERMRAAGIVVEVGLLEKEARYLNRYFITAQTANRPHIILKWAMSSDGYIDRYRSDYTTPPVLLSTPITQRWVHRLRSQVDAIMVGTRTALLDNPSLRVKYWCGQSPLRIVIDNQLIIPSTHRLYADGYPTLVLTTQSRQPVYTGVSYYVYDPNIALLPQLMSFLKTRNIQSLLVEGGTALLQSFIDAALYDEIIIERSTRFLGEGVAAPDLQNTPYTLMS